MRYKKINKKVFLKKKFNFENDSVLKKDLQSVYSTICKLLYRIDKNDEVLDIAWFENDMLYLNSIRNWIEYDLKTKFLKIGIFKIKIDNQVINKIITYLQPRVKEFNLRVELRKAKKEGFEMC